MYYARICLSLEIIHLQVLKKQNNKVHLKHHNLILSCYTSTSPSHNTTFKEKNVQVAKT
ncbi:12530_t:CDS:2, partial [Ambispora leptoticha]